jgi:hypothetical protein
MIKDISPQLKSRARASSPASFPIVGAGLRTANPSNQRLAHILALVGKAEALNLGAADSFFMAPVTELDRAYNGCGPAALPDDIRAGLTKYYHVFEPAILIHDYENSLSDGTKKGFKRYNRRLFRNCIKLAFAAYSWRDIELYLWLFRAWYLWRLCARFGWSAWEQGNLHHEEHEDHEEII